MDVGAEKDETGELAPTGGRIGAGHRAAHQVAAGEPRAYLGVRREGAVRGVLFKDDQVERHLDEDGQVAHGLDLGPGIEDERRGRTQAGRITWSSSYSMVESCCSTATAVASA